jgi:uncharacterized protein (DUF924 family)
MNPQTIIDFWFKELTPQQWWVKDLKLDNVIKDRFSDIHKRATLGELESWRDTAQGRLAEVIILDQFSRNIYRDTPLSFASDPQALTLAQEAIRLNLDKELSIEMRTFLYLPYMHSESLLIHDIAMELFDIEGLEYNLDFEKKHRDIIERFGRYPHRNNILGRESTAEEIEFLKQPGSSF